MSKGISPIKTDPDHRIKTYNNIRGHHLTITLDEYQKFHRDGDDAVKQRHDLIEWFHFHPGFFLNRNFVNTVNWPDPRRFLAIDGTPSEGEEIRSWLIAMDGIRGDGSCFDFIPYVAPSSTLISFRIRNLREMDTGGYRDPVDIKIEFSR